MARQPLPDPQWLSIEPRDCLRCGYALAGLGDTGTCPECGEIFCAKYLQLAGVSQSVASGTRRVIWIALIIGTIVESYTWAFQSRYVCATVGLIVVGGFLAMFLTSRRERSSIERYIVSPGGICRRRFRAEPGASSGSGSPDTLFVPWSHADTVNIKRLGAVWKRLQIGRTSSAGVFMDVVFDAGIRCPDESVEPVRTTIQQLLRAHAAGQPDLRSAPNSDPQGP